MKTQTRIFLISFILIFLFTRWTGYLENSYFELSKSIAHGKLEIDGKTTIDKVIINGKIYSDKYPGLSLIFSTISLFNSETLMNTLMSFLSAFSILLLYKISKFYNKKTKVSYVFLILISSPIILFGSLFISEVFTATMILLVYYTTFIKREKFHFSGVFGGISIISNFWTSIPTFFIILSGFLDREIKTKKKIITSILLFLFLSIILVYNYAITHNLFVFPYKYKSELQNVSETFYGFRYSNDFWYVLSELLFGFYRGLFFYYPILLFAFIGLTDMIRSGYKKEAYTIIFSFVFLILLNSLFTWWWSGAFPISRYLYTIIPVAIIPLFFSFRNIEKSIFLKVIFFIFISISIFYNFIFTYPWEDYISNNKSIDEQYLTYKYPTSNISIFPTREKAFWFFRYGIRVRILDSIFLFGKVDIKDDFLYHKIMVEISEP